MSSSSISQRTINTVRALSVDMVEAANSGHPGAPLGCAPMAYLLFAQHMDFDAESPKWLNRDRFVLSNGHASALQYSLLHLFGYLSLEDLKAFRQVGSRTAGHPESKDTPGVEVTTGPLGQGFANAVGLAIGSANMAARYNTDEVSLFDNHTFVICGDGCLQEGVCCEAASLAGHLGLGSLIVLYDDNHITIDGDTSLSFGEDVLARFEAYGWHTSSVEDGDTDLEAIDAAIEAAKAETDRPSIIKVRTTIGYQSAKQGTAGVHGAPLGAEDAASVKEKLGLDGSQSFAVAEEVQAAVNELAEAKRAVRKEWDAKYAAYVESSPLGAELARIVSGELPEGWLEALPTFTAQDKATSTRKLSGAVLNVLNDMMPELIGGSADLTGSNCTELKNSVAFDKETRAGTYIRYGVREHAMAAVSNGLAAYGTFLPFAATFLVFLGYAQGAARLSALSEWQVIYIMTHDSIGLGEDGPTHQPIETLASWRATPNCNVIRPADGNETSGAYALALQSKKTPSVLALTRQNVPHLEGSSIEGTLQGGYVLEAYSAEAPEVVLVASGSEVGLIVEAASKVAARVVSMPCMEAFRAQADSVKREVFPDGLPVISVEASGTYGWSEFAHVHVGMDTFGESGKGEEVMEHFGFTVDNVVGVAEKVIAKSKETPELFGRLSLGTKLEL